MPAANPDKFKLARDLPRPGIVFALARVPDSARVYVGGSDFKVYEADLAAAKPEFREFGSHTSYVTGLALAGPAVVSGSYDGRLIWWDPAARAPRHTVEAHAKWVRKVAASPDGKTVVSVADDMVARVWDGTTGRLRHELRGHAEFTPNNFPSMLFTCAVSPDGRFTATADKVGHVVVWDLVSGKQVAAMEAPGMYTWDPTARNHSIGGVRSLAFSPDGSLLAVGGMGKVGNIDHLEGKTRVEVFDWRKAERTHEFPGEQFKGLVEQLLFHPQGDWLLAAGGANDGFVMFFDLKARKVLRQEKAPAHLHAAALNEAGDTLYAAAHGRVVVFEMKG
jgi:WD40 repeat protein